MNMAADLAVDDEAKVKEDGFDIAVQGEQNYRGVSKMNHNKRLEYLMELKLRLDVLDEIGGGGFDNDEMKAEKIKIFQSLSTVASSSCKNRHLVMMETKIRFDILKDLKKADVHTSRCVKMMKDMYIGLPPLMGIDDVSPINMTVNHKKVERMAKKAARNARRGEKKKSASVPLMNADNETADKDSPAEDEWEVLDEMEEVNDSVASMKMKA